MWSMGTHERWITSSLNSNERYGTKKQDFLHTITARALNNRVSTGNIKLINPIHRALNSYPENEHIHDKIPVAVRLQRMNSDFLPSHSFFHLLPPPLSSLSLFVVNMFEHTPLHELVTVREPSSAMNILSQLSRCSFSIYSSSFLQFFSESELHRKFCRHLVLVSYINVRLAGARVSCCCQSSRKGFKIWVLMHSSVLLSQISFIHTLTHEQKTKTLHRFFLHEAYGFISSRFFVGR